MTEHAAVLFANDAFYTAFANRDVDAMDALWSRKASVTCLHPGWRPLFGRDAVMESWRGILLGSHAPDIRCRDAKAFVYGEVAVVICDEVVDGTFLVASNVFVRDGRRWEIVYHQAAAAPPPEEVEDEPPQSLQ